MNESLLRRYIAALVLERIRSNKGKFGQDTKFNLKTFKSLERVEAMRDYADTFLKQLGKGSSRVAYLLSSKYVLKIALNEAGIAQNKAEVDVYTSPKTRPFVATVHASHDRYAWVVEDLVKELTSEKEFESLTGISWRQFHSAINLPWDTFTSDPQGKKDDKIAATHQHIKNGKGKQFLHAVAQTASALHLGIGDIQRLEHWGKTPDGRAVLLDFGYTAEVWQKHYSTGSQKKTSTSHSDHDKPTVRPGQDDSTAPAKPQR